MSKILIDTNILLWSIFETHLGQETKVILETAQEICVSAISVLEIKIKQEIGKLPIFDIEQNVKKMGFTILPLTASQSENYRIHDARNKDPFDNTLLAVALTGKLQFMTSDKLVLSAKIPGLETIDGRK